MRKMWAAVAVTGVLAASAVTLQASSAAAASYGVAIHSAKSGRCLDADLNTIGGNGTKVQLWDCNGQPQQKWYYDGKFTHSGYNARCLDADLNTIGGDGTKVQLWDCNGQPQQQWPGATGMPLSSSCAAYSNAEVWQTSTTWGRVRERPCVWYNPAVVFAEADFQIDWPSSCSLSVGFPPSAGLSCPLSIYYKGNALRFNSAQLQVGLGSGPFGRGDVGCSYGPFLASGSTYTLACSGQMQPRRAGVGYTVFLHDIGGDAANDGDGTKLLQPGQFTFGL